MQNNYSSSAVYITPYLEWISNLSAVKENSYMHIDPDNGKSETYYWHIKTDDSFIYSIFTPYDSASFSEAFDSWNISFIDKNNKFIKYDYDEGGWPLKGGQEYCLRIRYTFDDDYSDYYYDDNLLFCFAKDKNHEHSEKLKESKAATCASAGYRKYVCTVCGYERTVNIARKTDHTYKNFIEKATLTKNGKIESKCSVCGKINKKTIVYYPKTITLSKLEAKSKGFKATWKKQVKQTTGYEIQYSTSSKFTAKTTKTVTVKKAKTLTKTISKLKSGKMYYVRIRTYKTVDKVNYYSAWSKVKNVKTK